MKICIVVLLVTSIILISATRADPLDQLESDNVLRRYSRCSTNCPAVGKPVCASNNRCIKLFNNSCLLRLNNCRSPQNQRYNECPIHYCKKAKPCK